MLVVEKDKSWAGEIRQKIRAKLSAETDRVGSDIPYIALNGRYTDKGKEELDWWTNGFWPGILWLMYADTKDEKYLKAARGVEDRLDECLKNFVGVHHDVGFMWHLSAGLDYRLTGNAFSKVRALHAANILAGRYNPRGHFIRAWNMDRVGWIIIDCLMNIPLLYWASRETGDPRFKFIAIEHADTALKHLLRPDGSCNHIGILDPENGDLLETPGGQGYAAGSSWTRGQAWAVYGFALSALHTGEARYLDAAKRVAHYFVASVAEYGYVPPVDFRSPREPLKLDTTAGTITACGLLQIAELAGEYEQKFYLDAALNILKAIEEKHCDWDPSRDSIVQNGSAQYFDKPDSLHVPIIYGDYFFIEAVHRLINPDLKPW
jgi:unsaturated chondroitin disaccharide hydrolase